MNDDYEEIVCEYTEKRKGVSEPKTTRLKYFPNRQIATICDTFENPETHKIETKISKPGMTKEELLRFFKGRKGACNIEKLVGSIIYEAYRKEGLVRGMDEGNVRSFWYTHLKAVLVGILGREETESLKNSTAQAWTCVIDSGVVTYEEMNIWSEKESGRLSVIKDSPFNNIIIAVEKLSFFNTFSWLPRLFNCTLITAGGQPSRAVTRRFILELKELNVDLDQDFHMCVASDLDPAGYMIQEAFKEQFEKAIQYYGGTGTVKLHRLFVRKDQVTSDLLNSQAIPWKYKTDAKNKETTKKQEDTVWLRFCEKTDGGLFITRPDGEKVRALLEMNAFSTPVIENALVNELLRIIRETNDESKIMIPEIMRVFDELKNEVAGEVYERWERILIGPLKEEFFKEAEKWEDSIVKLSEDAETEINERYDGLIEEKEDEKHERVPELFEKKEKLEDQIDKLKERLSRVEEEINKKCEDIDEEISKLNDNRQEELQPISDAYEFRIKRYKQFKEEHLTVFNPIEQSLKSNIEAKLTEIDHRFQDLEKRDSIKKEISSLCTNYKLLTEEDISCFYQPVPTFKGEKFLEKASKNKDLNIEKVRDSFTPTFIDAMREIWDEDTRDLSFELGEVAELKDISQEIKEAREETEKALEEKEDEERAR